MKKLFLALLLTTLLAACGSDDAEKDVNADAEPRELEETDSGIEDGKTLNTTDDPMEIITDDQYDAFVDGAAEYKVVGKYTNEETDENGMVTVEKDGYTAKFAFIIVENSDGEELVYMMGEHENDNPDSDRIGIFGVDIKTSEKETIADAIGTDFIEPDTRAKFAESIYFEYGVPESFEFTMKEPIDKEVYKEEMLPEDKEPNDWKDFEFHKQ
ncbi:hypothetical protein [Oceanobacillus sp. J11TS1]|uniref:hypothetical protein n=1 Tax=Oceanobacillus sp. J11TS1 TaxID=2807191 RepID=UPI001B0FF544|nr:hypothetical protein [Oceanobacillus sp. J11TS1]GIO23924.1 hypothetical protein J11TS1_25050 [Oceanobacillus sp. J11TS1]